MNDLWIIFFVKYKEECLVFKDHLLEFKLHSLKFKYWFLNFKENFWVTHFDIKRSISEYKIIVLTAKDNLSLNFKNSSLNFKNSSLNFNDYT